MFPECRITKLFFLGVAKLRYSCSYGLAPYFIEVLIEIIKKAEIYVTLFYLVKA